jgi:hypothetical protein
MTTTVSSPFPNPDDDNDDDNRIVTIPQSCPSNQSNTTLEALLEKSLAMERQIVQDYHDDTSPELLVLLENDQEEHKIEFWSSTHKYCSADISIIMKDNHWLECFQKLD